MADIPLAFEGSAVTIAYAFLTTSGATINISTATAITLHLRKPMGTMYVRATSDGVTFKSGGSDGVVKYTTSARVGSTTGDLDMPGIWSGQFEQNSSVYSGLSTVFTFRVRPALERQPVKRTS